MFTSMEGRNGGALCLGCPINPDCNFSASQSADDIGADIPENLFASLIVGYSQLLDDSQVRFRIGEIIAQAMSQPSPNGEDGPMS
jgi:hypothetical protein